MLWPVCATEPKKSGRPPDPPSASCLTGSECRVQHHILASAQFATISPCGLMRPPGIPAPDPAASPASPAALGRRLARRPGRARSSGMTQPLDHYCRAAPPPPARFPRAVRVGRFTSLSARNSISCRPCSIATTPNGGLRFRLPDPFLTKAGLRSRSARFCRHRLEDHHLVDHHEIEIAPFP
jgi:hypothetical protein